MPLVMLRRVERQGESEVANCQFVSMLLLDLSAACGVSIVKDYGHVETRGRKRVRAFCIFLHSAFRHGVFTVIHFGHFQSKRRREKG